MRVRLVPVRDVFARMRFVVRDLARETGQGDRPRPDRRGDRDRQVRGRAAGRPAPAPGPQRRQPRAGAAGRAGRGREAAARPDRPAGGRGRRGGRDRGRGRRPRDRPGAGVRPRPGGRPRPARRPDRPGRGARPDLHARVLDPRDAPTGPAAAGSGWTSSAGRSRNSAARSTLRHRPGRGTRFTARLPLTLAIADALIVAVGGQTYAVPQAAVREVVQVEPGGDDRAGEQRTAPPPRGRAPAAAAGRPVRDRPAGRGVPGAGRRRGRRRPSPWPPTASSGCGRSSSARWPTRWSRCPGWPGRPNSGTAGPS